MKRTIWLPRAAISYYSEKQADFESPIISANAMDSQTQISADAVQFGFSVFEGMRAYVVDNKYIVFRSRDHHERMVRSCAALDMPCPSYETFINAISLIVEGNYDQAEGGLLYIRPLVFATSGGIMAQQHRSFAYAALCTTQDISNGDIKVLVETNSPRTVPAFSSVKTASNYANAGLITRKAQNEGYDTVLWLDGNGNVQECTTMNIFFCMKGEISTPRLGNILPGITRRTMIELLRGEGCEVTERDLHISEITDSIGNRTMSYMFATSTALGISRVTHLRHLGREYTIGGETPNSISAATKEYRMVTKEFPRRLSAYREIEERSYLGVV
jgi:branched-chain amino acid aminotransferase